MQGNNIETAGNGKSHKYDACMNQSNSSRCKLRTEIHQQKQVMYSVTAILQGPRTVLARDCARKVAPLNGSPVRPNIALVCTFAVPKGSLKGFLNWVGP